MEARVGYQRERGKVSGAGKWQLRPGGGRAGAHAVRSPPRQDPATEDLNRDDQPDLVVTGWAGQVMVLLGGGGGSFGAPASFLGATDRSVTADFTSDGNLDVLSVSLGSNQVSFARGNGDGTFQSVEGLSMGEGWAASADFDLDANQDIAMVLCCNELGALPRHRRRHLPQGA